MATTFPNWNGTKRVTLEQIIARDTFRRLHVTMQQRVRDLILGSDGRVGLLEGYRSPEAQERMFRERYVPDDNGSVTWNGQRWRHVSGATAAPPGRSMHELGLATDLSGDTRWVVKHCGSFGLKCFADVNDEPWHVQPVELPNGRMAYERMGSPWAVDVSAAVPAGPSGLHRPVDAALANGEVPPEVLPGARDATVRVLQQVLIRLGLIRDTPGNRDGHYGTATQAVIMQFQRKHGLRDDAKVGPKTWAALLAADRART